MGTQAAKLYVGNAVRQDDAELVPSLGLFGFLTPLEVPHHLSDFFGLLGVQLLLLVLGAAFIFVPSGPEIVAREDDDLAKKSDAEKVLVDRGRRENEERLVVDERLNESVCKHIDEHPANQRLLSTHDFLPDLLCMALFVGVRQGTGDEQGAKEIQPIASGATDRKDRYGEGKAASYELERTEDGEQHADEAKAAAAKLTTPRGGA